MENIMAEPLRTEKQPLISVPHYVTPPGRPYQVKDGDSWLSIARMARVDPWDLIEFNFQTRSPSEINWYLREYVGCVQSTPDGRNWIFSTGLTGGKGAWKGGAIWLPLGQTRRGSRPTNVLGNAFHDDFPDIIVVANGSNGHVK
jgi:hypothetical protein